MQGSEIHAPGDHAGVCGGNSELQEGSAKLRDGARAAVYRAECADDGEGDKKCQWVEIIWNDMGGAIMRLSHQLP